MSDLYREGSRLPEQISRLLFLESVVAGRQQLDVVLNQPDFGIAPYRAMLGALKIQADVTVRVTDANPNSLRAEAVQAGAQAGR